MPYYEYRCNECGAVTELKRAMRDRKKPFHCSCGSKDTELLISSCSFVLKGTGWYATDYATSKPEKK